MIPLLAMVGCGSGGAAAPGPAGPGGPRPPTGFVADPSAMGPCPAAVNGFPSHVFWAHELFTGCSPPPFWAHGVTCLGDCPTPCRETAADPGSDKIAWKADYTYAEGLLSTARGGRWPSEVQCEYEGGRLAGCRNEHPGSFAIRRDDRGRIVQVDEPTTTLVVTYDAAGHVATMRAMKGVIDATLTYEGGRLAVEQWAPRGEPSDPITYEYDARGRFAGSSAQHQKRRYDATTGLLVEVSEDVGAGGGTLGHSTTTITYDEWNRPTVLSTTIAPPGGAATTSEIRYSYDCTGDR